MISALPWIPDQVRDDEEGLVLPMAVPQGGTNARNRSVAVIMCTPAKAGAQGVRELAPRCAALGPGFRRGAQWRSSGEPAASYMSWTASSDAPIAAQTAASSSGAMQ